MGKYYNFLDKTNVKVRKKLRTWQRWHDNNYSAISYILDKAVPFILIGVVILTASSVVDTYKNNERRQRQNLISRVTQLIDKNNNNQLDPPEVMEIYRTLNKPYNRDYPNQDLKDYLEVTQN